MSERAGSFAVELREALGRVLRIARATKLQYMGT